LAGQGDWDLAVYDGRTGAVVAGSAGFSSNELAEGYVTAGQSLIMQACRFRGPATSVTLSVEFFATAKPVADSPLSDLGGAPTTKAAQPVQVVRVATPTRADKRRLQGLGLDLTEHGDAKSLEVVLSTAADAETLKRANFTYTVKIADLAAKSAANRRADATYAAKTKYSQLPSGRTSYRRLFDYELELKQLAIRYPGLIRPLILPERTHEGRDVVGIEITNDAAEIADGKPVFVNMGLHHAREWPAAEHPMEFAYDLIRTHWTNAKVKDWVSRARTIVIPVINPDGFNISREAPSIGGDFSLFDYEYKRKNCRASDSPPEYSGDTCGTNAAGRLRGTDPNRNYGAFWGGVGASPDWSSDTFRGSAPFSEPEVENVRQLVSSRSVTNLISNHTYSHLILRAPGVAATKLPLDEPINAALADRMARHNGYTSQLGFELYDTTGTTDDWAFWHAAALSYTFEIGPDEFHPPYQTGVVAEYRGLAPAAGAGTGGNSAAYYEMLRSTVDAKLHSTITGRAPEGSVLKVRKQFTSKTSPVIAPNGTVGDPISYPEELTASYAAPGGPFSFAVNPSTRPLVAGRLGRDALADPQPNLTLVNPAGVPAENTGDPLLGPNERIPFTIKGLPEADNGRAEVSIKWARESTDWDLYVLNSDGEIVATSAQGDTDFETAVLLDPPAGEYTAVLVNYIGGDSLDWDSGAVTFASPDPSVIGPKESWTLTCERPGGAVSASRSVQVDRGKSVDVGDVCRPDAAKR
ncbi:MAG: M14 family zinc carboxypeptidase, partial [Angustibacter sp.]